MSCDHISAPLLQPHRKESLEGLVTGDESWVLYDSISRYAALIPRDQDASTMPKSDLHPRKLLLFCWNSKEF